MSLESRRGCPSLGEQHPVLAKAGAVLLAAALPPAARACEHLGASGFVPTFFCHSFLCGSEVSQLERAFFQGNHNCAVLVWDDYSHNLFGRELTVNER